MEEELAPCSHAEADTRVFVHLRQAVSLGFKDATVKTVDTDLVVIALSQFDDLAEEGLEKLYIEFGTGKTFR